MSDLLNEFFQKIKSGQLEIYNEFSLQHELGFFLRSIYPSKKIQFERNVAYFGFKKTNFIKREIDISILSSERTDAEAYELKFPRNGQYPEQMFSFCKDILFLEQLMEYGFKKAKLLILAEDKNFYSGKSKDIYSYFRDQNPLTGLIRKPTGAKNEIITINGTYVIK